MKEQCSKQLRNQGMWPGYHQCTRKAWKDGYCKQHHPDTVKARREASQKRYEEKRTNSVYARLDRANRRIAELEAELLLERGKENQ